MGTGTRQFKHIVAAFAAAWWFSLPSAAPAQDAEKMADLFAQLQTAETADAGARVADAIVAEWSKSGSAAIDLLLQRGEEAMGAGDPVLAAGHFTAAIDHAPDFAEAWHGRAAAYYMAGLVGPALDDLRQVLVLNPQHFDAMGGFAIILEELERPEQALEVWRKVAALHPTDVGAAGAIARLELALGGRTL
jgi:tetratricopeptide (TPR) repeat protein